MITIVSEEIILFDDRHGGDGGDGGSDDSDDDGDKYDDDEGEDKNTDGEYWAG